LHSTFPQCKSKQMHSRQKRFEVNIVLKIGNSNQASG